MKLNMKQILPYLTALVLFIVITLFYFKPLLSGKTIYQHDIVQAKGMSKELVDYRTSENKEAVWTNAMFGGMPAYQISTLYPGNWLGNLDRAVKLFLPHPSGYVFFCFLGFFILLLCLDINPWLAIAGALAFGFSSYLLIVLEAGHNSKINAVGYLPPLIGGVILLFKGRFWLGTAVTAFFMALEINANHVQITYYGFMLMGGIITAYFYYALKNKQLPSFFKSISFFVVASVIALLPNIGSLWCTYEYGKYTTRGQTELTIDADMRSNKTIATSGLDKAYVTHWSYGISETINFFIPNYKGGGSSISINETDKNAVEKVNPDLRQQIGNSPAYFGDQPGTGGPSYVGAIIMFLAVLGLFIIKHPIKWGVVVVTLLCIALGWGKNFMGLTNFFLDYVPGYNKFRAVTIIMVIPEITIPLLAMLAVNELLKFKSLNDTIKLIWREKGVELKKILVIAFALTGGFALVGYVMPNLVNTFTAENEAQQLLGQYMEANYPKQEAEGAVMQVMEQLTIARVAIFKADAMRSFLLIASAFGLLWLLLLQKINRHAVFAGLGILILVDMWTVDKRYLNDKSFESKAQYEERFAKTQADEEILKDTSPNYRVLNLTKSWTNDASTSYWHKSVGGYHGAKLKKYQELIEFQLQKDVAKFYNGLNQAMANDSTRRVFFESLKILNMLNTKYFIVPGGERGEMALPLANPASYGNAWLIKSLQTVASADSEIVGLGRIDTRNQAILQAKNQEALNLKKEYAATGTISLSTYKPNYLTYNFESGTDEFVVFSEIYYPKGWNAYVDGQLQPHINVNYVLRGMPIAAGKHKIEFKFEPQAYKTGNSIARIGSVALFGLIGACLFFWYRQTKTQLN